jgi:hypothetical protein
MAVDQSVLPVVEERKGEQTMCEKYAFHKRNNDNGGALDSKITCKSHKKTYLQSRL